jgi:asparagine synthase (glutamine-hydrolysing)
LPAASPSDAELILAAYREWGTQCVSRLLGDFAFAIFDPRRHLVFCARDPMGVKPLYYCHAPGRFVFATEMKALLGVPGIPATIDDDQVALYLATTAVDRVSTFYQHIKRLPAAQRSLLRPTSSSCASIGALMPVARCACAVTPSMPPRSASASAPQSARDCATRRPWARVSGGLDSSSIVCTARQLGVAPLHTFFARVSDLEGRALRSIDERGYIEHVTAAGGVQPHYVRGDELSPLAIWTQLWRTSINRSARPSHLHQGMRRGPLGRRARVSRRLRRRYHSESRHPAG